MTVRYNGIGRVDQWENLRRPEPAVDEINVGWNERLLSGAAAFALAVASLRRRRAGPVLLTLAGALATRALTGSCPINRALGRNTARDDYDSPVASVGRGEGIRVEQSVMIGRPSEELFAFWRNFENLPRFMDHLESVRVLDQRRSHWTVKGPAGTRVEWEAEVHHEVPGELIAWRSLPGAEVDHAGSVHFTPVPGDATEVRVLLRYDPPAGRLGAAVARLFGEEPSQQVAEDLRRFKQVMEAGEAATAGPL